MTREHTIERAVLVGLNADCFSKEETATKASLEELPLPTCPFPLQENLREKPSAVARYLAQKPCTGMLRLPGGVGVDVHGRVDIQVSQQLLHILGGRTVGKKIAGERWKWKSSKPGPFPLPSGTSDWQCWGI